MAFKLSTGWHQITANRWQYWSAEHNNVLAVVRKPSKSKLCFVELYDATKRDLQPSGYRDKMEAARLYAHSLLLERGLIE